MNIDAGGSAQPSKWDVFFQQIERFNRFMEYSFSLPMTIIEKAVDNIQNLVTNHTISCSICLGVTITTTLSVASLAIGLGVGLGVGCSKTNILYTNSTTV